MHVFRSSTVLPAFALTFLLTACGSGGSSNNNPNNITNNNGTGGGNAGTTISGSVDGHSLTVGSSSSAAFSQNGNFLVLVLSSQSNYCGAITAGDTHPNHTSFVAALFAVDANVNSPVVGPGTYTVVAQAPTTVGSYANTEFHVTDGNCNDTIPATDGTGSGGTIVLTNVTSANVVGTFNVTFGSNTLSGSFSSPTCAALGNLAENGTALTCTPN